jgi:hypothetical protein
MKSKTKIGSKGGPVSSPAPCWAALAGYVERKRGEARRELNDLSRCRDEYKPLHDYWEGQYVALVKLKRRFERCVKAQPNDSSSDAPNL